MKNKKAQPSFSGLLRIRKGMVGIQQSLTQAYAWTNDPSGGKLDPPRPGQTRRERKVPDTFRRATDRFP